MTERTFLTCTWSEPHIFAWAPLGADDWGGRWCCLALSERAGRHIEVRPDRCAACALWEPRAELRSLPGPDEG